jgi:hypothetical protein
VEGFGGAVQHEDEGRIDRAVDEDIEDEARARRNLL